ncbi:MAG: PTS lactose/cellobiose transporter subunit IIA [Erysipelotrichia bacterium]|nr:PTS lactose/cellobiose transporter subunit IIA [Erysipelotrichia bacterium]NCC55414.1 PTS lactose/cellobiose transporter subunit IIA [Erysipelotrichia bacterium]
MEGIELICFEIISAVGSARSCYIEAIQKAKEKDFVGAKEAIANGDEMFNQGHSAHAKLISQEANGDQVQVVLLLVHAEDQLMSAETFKILANEFIDLYEKI